MILNKLDNRTQKNEQHASFFVKYVKKQASNEKNGCIFAYKEDNLMKSKNKSEIASAAGVSLRTLRNWLQNPKAQHILQKYGHKQTDRILCPGAVRELCEYFDIQFD